MAGNPELMEQLSKNRSLVLGGQDTCQVKEGGENCGVKIDHTSESRGRQGIWHKIKKAKISEYLFDPKMRQ